jgi:signal transduction histidine kinase
MRISVRSLPRFAALAAILSLLIAGWVALYVNSHAVDTAGQGQTLDLVTALKQLDADWSANVLRSHADLNPNYDALGQPLRPFAEKVGKLQERAQAQSDPELIAAVADLHKLIADKSDLIDRFKAQNSLYKNSLRYVPTVHQEIQDRMRADREAGLSAQASAQRNAQQALADLDKVDTSSEEGRERMRRALATVRSVERPGASRNVADAMSLEGRISALVSEALRYSAVPDRDAAELIRQHMDELRAQAANVPGAAREPVLNLLAHLDTLLRLRTQQTDLLKAISRVPVESQLDLVGDRFTRRFAGELAVQFNYQRMLLAYSAFAVLLVIGATAFILVRSSTERRRLAGLVEVQTRALKDNEVHLVQAQRMAAVGEMVASVAHEVNTPLAAIKSSLQSAQDLMGEVGEHERVANELIDLFAAPAPEDEAGRAQRRSGLTAQYRRERELRRALAEIEATPTVGQLMRDGLTSVDHISSVVSNMLNFSRLDRTRVATGHVEQGIDETLVIANHLLRNVRVVKDYTETRPLICDMAQINQVVLNLVKNAVQALPAQGGEIKLSTSMASPTMLSVKVVDNGSGIPADVLPRIWDPFFTTKPEGEGTGLGLSTCRKIVEAHGGRLEVVSQPGRGTAFTMLLPLTPPKAMFEENGQQNDSRLVRA